MGWLGGFPIISRERMSDDTPDERSEEDVVPQRLVRLTTTCQRELWAGFFGYNANGDQPECPQEITVDVEEECVEREDGIIRPSFAVECPACGGLLEWPHEWEIDNE